MSLWPIPFAQNLLVCWVLFHFLATAFPNLPPRLRCAVIVLTGAVSYLPWASDEIMPDIYTPLILLLIFMLTFSMERMAGPERLIMLLLLALMISFHQASGPFAVGLMAMAAFLGVIRGRPARSLARTALPIAVCIFAAVGAQTLYGYVVMRRLTPSPSGPVFLLARVIYDGPGRAYLAKTCSSEHYSLCDHQNELVGDHNYFLWNAQSPRRYLGIRAPETGSPTPLQRAQRAADEAAAIVSGTLRLYPFRELLAAVANTGRQLVDFGSVDWCPCVGGKLDKVIHELFPREYGQFANSLQNRGWWCSRDLSMFQIAVVVLSLTMLSVMVASSWLRPEASIFLSYLLWGLVLNAALMGALSGPTNRYQARIIWMVPFITIALAADRWTTPGRPIPPAA